MFTPRIWFQCWNPKFHGVFLLPQFQIQCWFKKEKSMLKYPLLPLIRSSVNSYKEMREKKQTQSASEYLPLLPAYVSRTSLSRTRLFRITAYLEVKIWTLF